MPSAPRIAIFVSFSGHGGVERMMMNLAEGLVDMGCSVDLVMVKARHAQLNDLPNSINIVKLSSNHTFSSIFALTGYLKKKRPDALLAAKNRANQVAVLARRLSGVKSRIGLRMGTTTTVALEGRSTFKKWSWYIPMRWLYPKADEIIAVSKGVAEDLARITGLNSQRITVIANPVITPRVKRLAKSEADHPWLRKKDLPVILGVGRLTRQKDFPTLIKAFARLHVQRRCRLIILGEGKDKQKLTNLAEELNVADDLDFPGFVDNPYAYMNSSDLFVLSSIWEGSPNVLTEAMGLGVPVVATDCPSGPAEILQEGHYGPLVNMGDVEGLAEAMQTVLANPPQPEFIRQAVEKYTLAYSSKRYLEVLMGKNIKIATN